MKFHSTFDIFLPPKHYLIARCWLWSVDEKCLNVWLELKLWIKTTEINRVILATIYRCIITIFKDCFKRVVEFMKPRTDIRLLWNCHIGIVGSFVSLKTIFSTSGHKAGKQSTIYMKWRLYQCILCNGHIVHIVKVHFPNIQRYHCESLYQIYKIKV